MKERVHTLRHRLPFIHPSPVLGRDPPAIHMPEARPPRLSVLLSEMVSLREE